MVIDHVIPVAKGGSSEIDNLITSCEPCNSGKGTKDANPPDVGDNARMARLQMLKEQEETSKAAIKAIKLRQKFKQVVVEAWCKITGRDNVDSGTIGIICGYVEEFGIEEVLNWVEKAYVKCGYNDRNMGRYVSGIRRKKLEEEEQE